MRIGNEKNRMRPSLLVPTCVILSGLLAASVFAERRVNLPLDCTKVSVAGEGLDVIRAFFSEFESSDSMKLSEQVEQILLGVVPESYDSGCTAMIAHWGSDPTNVPGSLFRPIYVHKGEEGEPIVVLMAYRCFSHRDYYRDTYYDERLTALTITDKNFALRFLPHKWDCKDILALSRISVAETYQIAGEPLVSIIFSMSGENPCCDGPFSCDEEIVDYIRIGEDVVSSLASVVRHKEEYYHNDVEGDTEVIYDADISVIENSEGNAAEIVSTYTIKENEELREEGKRRYIWNVFTGRFEEGVE